MSWPGHASAGTESSMPVTMIEPSGYFIMDPQEHRNLEHPQQVFERENAFILILRGYSHSVGVAA
jgi:hypothetical protein